MNALLAGVVLFISIGVILFVFIIQFISIYYVLILSIFMLSSFLVALILYSIYLRSKRFAGVIDALGFELLDVRFENWKTMRFTTLTFGEFFLYYFGGSEDYSAYYKLWISTQKRVSVPQGNDFVIWKKPSWFQKIKNKGENSTPYYISKFQIEGIKSLSSLKIEITASENKIAAYLDDKWLHSEIPDLLKTLEVLRFIEEKI